VVVKIEGRQKIKIRIKFEFIDWLFNQKLEKTHNDRNGRA
jgi:hypothetical protein